MFKTIRLASRGPGWSHLRNIANYRCSSLGGCTTSTNYSDNQLLAGLSNISLGESRETSHQPTSGMIDLFKTLDLNNPSSVNQLEMQLSTLHLLSTVNQPKIIESPRVDITPILDRLKNLDVGIGDAMTNNWIVETPCRNPVAEDTVIGDVASRVRKEGRMIQKIRRWKMNRHQLKKLRKRMLFHNRKMRLRKEKKKERILQEEINAITKEAEDFDARQFVLNELETARRGGFNIDIWDTWQKKKQSQ